MSSISLIDGLSIKSIDSINRSKALTLVRRRLQGLNARRLSTLARSIEAGRTAPAPPGLPLLKELESVSRQYTWERASLPSIEITVQPCIRVVRRAWLINRAPLIRIEARGPPDSLLSDASPKRA